MCDCRLPSQEECRGWDVNEVVFSPGLWPTYHALMRADFTLFDEYEFKHEGRHAFPAHFCML
jgi:surfactin synthase thioesterase subunit